MRRVHVKAHKRRKPSGGTTRVSSHTRLVEKSMRQANIMREQLLGSPHVIDSMLAQKGYPRHHIIEIYAHALDQSRGDREKAADILHMHFEHSLGISVTKGAVKKWIDREIQSGSGITM